jgi:hypothetical protein
MAFVSLVRCLRPTARAGVVNTVAALDYGGLQDVRARLFEGMPESEPAMRQLRWGVFGALFEDERQALLTTRSENARLRTTVRSDELMKNAPAMMSAEVIYHARTDRCRTTSRSCKGESKC